VFKVNEIIRATGGKLLQGNPEARLKGVSCDSRKFAAGETFLALRGSNFDGHNFIPAVLNKGASGIIAQRFTGLGLPKNIVCVQVKDTTLALGDLARFHRQRFNLPVIAVTGSNGKTTTKEMVAWVLTARGNVLKNEGTQNNQIGLPQTLLRLKKSDDFAVVEIGTNHFGEVDYLAKIASANIGLITNIGPSHLEFLKNLKGVFREKTALLNNLSAPALTVLNADDALLRPVIRRQNNRRPVFSYGIKEKADFFASAIKCKNQQVRFTVNRKFDFLLSTCGSYNVYNALAAISVGRLLGFAYSELADRLKSFKFPYGRLRFVEISRIKFIDDTYNSNPLSLGCALETLASLDCKGRKILVMGDMRELGEKKELLHRQIAGSITNSCDLLITVGELARITADAVRKRGWKKEQVYSCASAGQARDLLLKKILPASCDLVLVKGSRSMKMEEVLKV